MSQSTVMNNTFTPSKSFWKTKGQDRKQQVKLLFVNAIYGHNIFMKYGFYWHSIIFLL